jgi:uncharacterized membrane protein YbhN (UPF0104 family)
MTTALLSKPAARPAGRLGRLAGQRWWRAVLLVGGVALAAVSLRGHLPDLSSTWATLRQASPAWLVAAVVLQLASMGAFAEQQRHLLAGFGVRMPVRMSLAVSYARSAMATALPGGSAVSAGYAFRQFRARGASQSVAAAVMLLSGVASVAGLILLYGGDALAWASPRTLAVAAAGTAVVTLAGVRMRVWLHGRKPAEAAERPSSWWSRLGRRLHDTMALAQTVPARRWLGVVALAMVNWLTDLACLLAALQAVGLTVPARTVATAYLVAQLIRQIPATPGGIGVIEASLIVALTTAGAAPAPAAAAVLIYRLLSCWTILPIGLACWTAQRSPAQLLRNA